ncbi:MAG: stage II sporulation protein D [Clostridia bacterium]|nr:stage II sporulation protein D [Clostridia bacterium]
MIVFFVLAALIMPLCVFFIINEDKPKTETSDSRTISIYFKDENAVRQMDIEEYLTGVVAAEVPASFEEEAIKAQAVAARSYAVYRAKEVNPDHPNAAVCTDYTHCKAYKTTEKAREDWGEKAEEYEKKIHDAVYSTRGEVLTYDGDVALTVFHSQSAGGRTENSADVWGGKVPYLVSVESHGEENAPNFFSSKDMTFEEFVNALQKSRPGVQINSYKDIGSINVSDGGNVKSIEIGGEVFSGTEIRSIFSLRSSCFKITADENNVHFDVTGYGHGVGMSQYGANQMAKEGCTYEQILTHYYTGTCLDYV